MCCWAIQYYSYISPWSWDINTFLEFGHIFLRGFGKAVRDCIWATTKKTPNSPLRKGILFRKFSFLYKVSQQGGDTLGFLPKFLFGDHFILLGNFVISLTKPFSGVRDPREVWDSVGTEDQWESAGDERFWMFHWHGKQERGKNQKQGTLQRFYVRNL